MRLNTAEYRISIRRVANQVVCSMQDQVKTHQVPENEFPNKVQITSFSDYASPVESLYLDY